MCLGRGRHRSRPVRWGAGDLSAPAGGWQILGLSEARHLRCRHSRSKPYLKTQGDGVRDGADGPPTSSPRQHLLCGPRVFYPTRRLSGGTRRRRRTFRASTTSAPPGRCSLYRYPFLRYASRYPSGACLCPVWRVPLQHVHAHAHVVHVHVAQLSRDAKLKILSHVLQQPTQQQLFVPSPESETRDAESRESPTSSHVSRREARSSSNSSCGV